MGFTLVELAVVLVIVAVLLGGLLMPLSAQLQARRMAETEQQLREIRDAVLGFAATNGYLPCPAKSAIDGNEDRLGSVCNPGPPVKRFGRLPWVTLGVRPTDAWGNLFWYTVTPAYANSAALVNISVPSGGTAADINVDKGAGTVDQHLTKALDIPVAFWSTGPNGYHGWQFEATVQNPDSAGLNTDEDTNATNGQLVISHIPSDAATPVYGEFDDVVMWITKSILFNRMIQAGRLP